MKVIDYYTKGLNGEGFPPPETFDSEYEFDEAWKEYTRGQNERYRTKYKGKKLYTDRGVKVFESQLKKRIKKIVETSCGKSRVREMDYEQEDEDPAELARFDALNNSKDEMLYRDNPIYREAYDEMTMRESKRRIRKIVQEANMDGTISADEEELEEELMAEAMIELDNIIAMVREESMRIGGEFRGPGIKSRVLSEMRKIINGAR